MTTTTPLLEVTSRGSTLILKVLPEKLHEFDTVQRVREQLLSEVQNHQPSVVILDLREVRLLGSVAFLAFLALRRQPKVQRVILCEMDALVLELFTICRLVPTEGHPNTPFEIAKSLDEALTRA